MTTEPRRTRRPAGLGSDKPDAALRGRLEEIRDNLVARIAEAEREDWLGEVEGLKVSFVSAEDKLAQIDRQSQKATISFGMPTTRSGELDWQRT